MLGLLEDKVSVIDTVDFCRVGSRDGLRLRDKSVYHKRITSPFTRATKMYNSEDKLVALESETTTETTIETIQNRRTGLTVVIIRDSDGDKYKGESRCNKSEDVFNPQIGFRIAHARAQVKKYEALIKSIIEELE